MRTTVRNSYTPKTGDYCNVIVIDEDNGVQYIFDSDGVFTTYTSKQQEGATVGYVDSLVRAATTSVKDYSDANDVGVLREAKGYADEKDAGILQAAKDYTDSQVGEPGVSKEYVDEQDGTTLQEAKNYADALVESGAAFDVSDVKDAFSSGSVVSSDFYASYLSALQSGRRLFTIDTNGYVVMNIISSSYSNSSITMVDESGLATYTVNPVDLTVSMTRTIFPSNQPNWNEVDMSSDTYIQNKPVVPVITLTDVDPGEGAPLAANHFIAVYDMEESE